MNEIEIQKARSFVKREIMKFLEENDYAEIDTPILAKAAIPESTIALFETMRSGDTIENEKFYLLPSPELYMKMFISKNKISVYQFSHCFRNNEQTSRIHSSEFTMLEYYKVGKDEMYSLSITEKLFAHMAEFYNIDAFKKPFRKVSMQSIVKDITGVDLNTISSKEDMRNAAESVGITVYDKSESIDDTFNRIFISLVEPRLNDKDEVVAIYDYPSFIECLAENTPNGKYKKRWELYYNGIELANCYKEETDIEKIKAYFRKEDALIKKRDNNFKSSSEFIASLLPQSSGVALGFDRFLMCLLKKTEIKDIIPFGYSL